MPWPLIATAAASAYSAYQSSKSSNAASDAATQGASALNTFNAAEAQKNRDFQERMTKNKHQYQVADLRAAGLNPILSATAGAAVPSGSSAQGVNINAHKPTHQIQKQQLIANLASTAAQIAKTYQENKILKAQAEKLTADNKQDLSPYGRGLRYVKSTLAGVGSLLGFGLGASSAKSLMGALATKTRATKSYY